MDPRGQAADGCRRARRGAHGAAPQLGAVLDRPDPRGAGHPVRRRERARLLVPVRAGRASFAVPPAAARPRRRDDRLRGVGVPRVVRAHGRGPAVDSAHVRTARLVAVPRRRARGRARAGRAHRPHVHGQVLGRRTRRRGVPPALGGRRCGHGDRQVPLHDRARRRRPDPRRHHDHSSRAPIATWS